MTPPDVSDKKSFKEDPLDPSMFELFCADLETQCKALNDGLLEIERNPGEKKILESLMRAGHSIKGAARIINLNPIVHLAHGMENFFSFAKTDVGKIEVEKIDILLSCVDLFSRLSKIQVQDVEAWIIQESPLIQSLIDQMGEGGVDNLEKNPTKKSQISTIAQEGKLSEEAENIEVKSEELAAFERNKMLRMTAENLNRLLGLAGETLVESRRFYPFEGKLENFKSQLSHIEDLLASLCDSREKEKFNANSQSKLTLLQREIRDLHHQLNGSIIKFDDFLRRHARLSEQLYYELIDSRMRPFADGIEAFPRLVRDLAHQLGKSARLVVKGEDTLLDREILEKLEAPITHLLRNAVDHGIESQEARISAGKPVEGLITLEARHQGGMLAISVSDDGKGADIELLRQKIVQEKLMDSESAKNLSDREAINYLFMPGFSTSSVLTEISGRGVGLNIVQKTALELGGTVTLQTLPGKGMSFYLRLPITLSVVRVLIVEVSGETFAFPLAQIDEVIALPLEKIQSIENTQFFHRDESIIKIQMSEKTEFFFYDTTLGSTIEKRNISLIPAWKVLELQEPKENSNPLAVIVLTEGGKFYGLSVERILSEIEIVVEELDPRLGKIKDISGGALLEDGSIALIIDISDIIRSIDSSPSRGLFVKSQEKAASFSQQSKHILIVDDSSTVREIESRLLVKEGYRVDTAADGLEGWNAIHTISYDLVIADIEMPRMNGIELLKALRKEPSLRSLPVMIVSYKAGEEDRRKGLKEGANEYLTKSSLQDTSLVNAVKRLIGDP